MMIVFTGVLQNPNDKALFEVKEIYEDNFPESERRPFDEISEQLKDGSYTLLVARENDDSGKIVGMALITKLAQADVAFLEYIAVGKQYQNEGIGSQLFPAILQHLRGKLPALVWEVELPTPDDTAMENRRIRWYQRLGSTFLEDGGVYQMPNFEDENAPGVPLRLMIAFADGQPSEDFSKERIEQIIRDIYAIAYPEHLYLLDSILLGLK
ncbi:MAG: GNAT family N-acetyltransferase [Scytonema sp. PMC 1069.18]|nr:GNAT family N-acetyltransferase [Scytonema sp. PMC 1069.18]